MPALDGDCLLPGTSTLFQLIFFSLELIMYQFSTSTLSTRNCPTGGHLWAVMNIFFK